MDTKLKNINPRSIVCAVSTIITVISATILMAGLVFLAMNMRFLSYIDEAGNNFAETKNLQSTVESLWIIIMAAGVVVLIGLLIAIITVGVKDEDGRYRLNLFDRLIPEIHIGIEIVAGCTLYGCIYLGYMGIIKTPSFANLISKINSALMKNNSGCWLGESALSDSIPAWVGEILGLVGAMAAIAVAILVLLSLIKKIKARCLLKDTITGRIICSMVKAFKNSSAMEVKVLIIAIALALLSATWIGLIPAIALIVFFVTKYVKKYYSIRQGIRELKNGNLEYKINITENGELDRLAMDINEISRATERAYERESKSNRMKTDLITNVSHDLRTPLTSMVSYVDLLQKEGFDSPNAEEYLNIVAEKTARLQTLTEDLFEAAKASSGEIPVDIQNIEMVSLINQALAETEEKLSAKNLKVIFENKADSANAMADGQLLWRVIDNLLVNAGKYALPGSRVYLDLTDDDKTVKLEIKNISEEPLNISADELMERFQRGDGSRNTEGSGLGLAIARDLTGLMKGNFEIKIDGDLFKAGITLRKALNVE